MGLWFFFLWEMTACSVWEGECAQYLVAKGVDCCRDGHLPLKTVLYLHSVELLLERHKISSSARDEFYWGSAFLALAL